MPHTVSDVLVVLKTDRSRALEEIERDMREQLEGMPGVAVLFTTPLGMRIDEGLGGTPADLSVRIFGPDLDELARLAEQAEGLIRGVDGIADLRAEQLTGLPQLQIAVNREATARVGLAPGDVIRAIRIGLVGEEQSQIWIGQRRFDLVVRCGTIGGTRSTRFARCSSTAMTAEDSTRAARGGDPDVRAGCDQAGGRHAPHRGRGICQREGPRQHRGGGQEILTAQLEAAVGLFLRSWRQGRKPSTRLSCAHAGHRCGDSSACSSCCWWRWVLPWRRR
jgi:hypothetical protein